MTTNTQAKKLSEYYSKLRADIKVFSNITCILDKIEADSHLAMLTSAIQHIFDQEMIYAVSGSLTRTQKIEATIN